jgi:hypothetical protein
MDVVDMIIFTKYIITNGNCDYNDGYDLWHIPKGF